MLAAKASLLLLLLLTLLSSASLWSHTTVLLLLLSFAILSNDGQKAARNMAQSGQSGARAAVDYGGGVGGGVNAATVRAMQQSLDTVC